MFYCFTDQELAREAAHARNARDAYAEGREPQEVLEYLAAVLREQKRRREAK